MKVSYQSFVEYSPEVFYKNIENMWPDWLKFQMDLDC